MSWVILIEHQQVHADNYSRLQASDLDAEWKKQILAFVQKWFSEDKEIVLKTSGSTGKPKQITYPKSKMLASAQRSITYFDLKANQTALLCLPAEFIAGKMMILRAIVGNLKLLAYEPTSRPLFGLETEIDFAAMTPMQAELSLRDDIDNFKHIKKLIIGGAPLQVSLERSLSKLQLMIYETYGMTETCSHIALRKIGDKAFHALEGVGFETDGEDRLVIKDEVLQLEALRTNDIVDLKSEKEFIWQGRSDWVINSGGIKLQAEQIEKKLSSKISAPLFVCGVKDQKLGEALVMIYEADEELPMELIKLAEEVLAKYERPKKYYRVVRLERLGNGKLDRKASRALLGI